MSIMLKLYKTLKHFYSLPKNDKKKYRCKMIANPKIQGGQLIRYLSQNSHFFSCIRVYLPPMTYLEFILQECFKIIKEL